MSQTNRSRFNATIISTGWTGPIRPENGSGKTVRVATALNHERPPSTTSLAVRPVPATTAVVARDWSSPAVVLEGVDLPDTLDPRLAVLRDPTSAQARSYRLLQHRLLGRFRPHVIAVTSAKPKEGKTTCAANLALALSEETFSRVLLVEANIPRPGIGQLFGFEPKDSFMDRLVQRLDPAPPYYVAGICGSRLQVAALRTTTAPDLRLDRVLLHATIRMLRSSYDYIVIDAPSVLESADVDVIGACADGFVVTARAGKSHKSSLRRAIDQLSPAKAFGVVLIDT